MIRMQHGAFSQGLRAVAIPSGSTVTVTVSAGLDPAERRQAMHTALRAARRAGWIEARVPVFLLPLLVRKPVAAMIAAGGKVHAAAVGAAALTAAGVVTAAVIAVAPPTTAPAPAAPRPPVAAVHGHRGRRVRSAPKAARPRLRAAARYRPPPALQGSGYQAPSPAPSQIPAPSASVSASVAPSPGASSSAPVVVNSNCIWVLGLPVCVGL